MPPDAAADPRRRRSIPLRFFPPLLPVALGLYGLALPLSVAWSNAGWSVTLAALLFQGRLSDIWRAVRRDAIFWLLCAYVAVAALAGWNGEDPARSFHYLNRDAHKAWIYALLSGAFSRNRSPLPLLGLAAGFSIAAIIGIGQALLLPPINGEWMRAHAFVHPVTFGQQMAFGALGAIALLLHPPRFAEDDRTKRWIAGFAALLLAALTLSHTRSALLACAAGAAVLAGALPRTRRAASIALAGLVLGFGLMELRAPRRSLVREAWRRAHGERAGGQSLRFAVWEGAWRIAKDRPWTGVGPHNFRAAFSRVHSGDIDGDRDWGDAHNLFLHELAERGVAGLIAVLLLFASFLRRAAERARERANAGVLWAVGATAAFLIMNLTEVSFETELLWMLFFFVWASSSRLPTNVTKPNFLLLRSSEN